MRQLLISYHRGWVASIAASLDHHRYAPTFADPGLVDQQRFDVVLPLRFEHYPAVRAAQALGARSIVPDPATVALCDDKFALITALNERGLAHLVPPLLNRVQAGTLAVIKPRHGEWGERIRIVDAPCTIAPDSFAQTAVLGRYEFALHAVRYDDEIRFLAVVRYDMGYDLIVRSDQHRAVDLHYIDPAPFAPFARLVLDALDYSGTACINFKLLGTTPQILEVNPRYGASLGTNFTAYADAICSALGLD